MKRILIKLSGEMLAGDSGYGIDQQNLLSMADAIHKATQKGILCGIVVGAGNIMRGSSTEFLTRTKADNAGMLGTAINAIALQDTLEREFNTKSLVLGAFQIDGIFEKNSPQKINEAFSNGYTIIFAGGIGCPFFSTDTTGVLKALEIDADLMIKATKVDGVYTRDPQTDSSATRYEKITYQEVLEKKLNVMDLTAIALAMEQKLPIRVTELTANNLINIIEGKSIGTLVSSDEN